jgi:hypothetical protein
VLLIAINTIINIIKLVMEWRSTKEKATPTIEHSHHQHHYDEQHHLDDQGYHVHEREQKGWLSGLLSRSGSYDGSGGIRSIANAHDIAYSAQKPTQTSAYSVQELSQDTAGYAIRPAEGPARSAQTSVRDSTGYRQTSI